MAASASSSQSAHHLGEATGYYPGRKTRRRISLGLAILFILAGLGILFYGLWQAGLQFRNYGPAMMGRIFFWPGLLTCGALVLSAVLGLAAVRSGNKTLTIFKTGFVLRERNKVQVWGWEDVAAITSSVTRNYLVGIYSGSRHIYTLERVDGSKALLDDSIRQVEQAMKSILQQTFTERFERVVQQIESGKSVPFGQILLSNEGLRVGHHAYGWGDLQNVQMQNGVLHLIGATNASVKVREIPNPDVLVTILLQNIPSS